MAPILKPTKLKTVYRYRITKLTGCCKKMGFKVGSVLVENRPLGETYTWPIFDMEKHKIDGTITAVYIGTGKLSPDGKKLL